MELPLSELATIIGALVALGLIVKYFLAHLKDKSDAFLLHLKEKDEIFTNVIQNHLSHSTETQERLVSAVNRLHDKI